jgi:pSer/pThr/pTyr-binding forkhead associated (FHA) protein
MGVFKFKDELSTNGTFVNDEFKEEGILNDGDNVKIGSTILKFRTTG